MKIFIESQFAYVPIVWTCCDETSNNYTNQLQKRALRMVYNQNVTIFKKLLEKGNFVIINLRNLTILARELNKTNRNVAAPIMHEIFEDWPNNRFIVRASKTS